MAQSKKNQKKIFISWSGDNSKLIAKALKETLEKEIFINKGLQCFVSDVDISSGADWWNTIKTELKKCKLGIACITKENLLAPWIYFESGAMIAHNLKLIPLLFNCNIKALSDTPLGSKHMVDFYNQDKFIKMVSDINEQFNLLQIDEKNLEQISINAHKKLMDDLSPTLKRLKAMRVFNEKYIYPQNVTTVNLKTVYISAPMSSLNSYDYYELRDFLLELKPKLAELGFVNIICPLFANSDYEHFDGNTKAIKENFVELKQVDSMIVIYPSKSPSSVLVEIGYGLALCKKTVIFHREELPFILKDAGVNISHIDTRQYESFEDIMNIIDSNGKKLFKLDEDD